MSHIEASCHLGKRIPTFLILQCLLMFQDNRRCRQSPWVHATFRQRKGIVWGTGRAEDVAMVHSEILSLGMHPRWFTCTDTVRDIVLAYIRALLALERMAPGRRVCDLTNCKRKDPPGTIPGVRRHYAYDIELRVDPRLLYTFYLVITNIPSVAHHPPRYSILPRLTSPHAVTMFVQVASPP